MAGTIDWDAIKDSLASEPDFDVTDLGQLSIDSFFAKNRGITVAELRAEREAVRAERRAAFEDVLDALIDAQRSLTAAVHRNDQASARKRKERVDTARARVLALWDASRGEG